MTKSETWCMLKKLDIVKGEMPTDSWDLSGVDMTESNFSKTDLSDAILNEKTDAQNHTENHPSKGKKVRITGGRTWIQEYIGKTGVLTGFCRSICGEEILLDEGQTLDLYSNEYEFIP